MPTLLTLRFKWQSYILFNSVLFNALSHMEWNERGSYPSSIDYSQVTPSSTLNTAEVKRMTKGERSYT